MHHTYSMQFNIHLISTLKEQSPYETSTVSNIDQLIYKNYKAYWHKYSI